MHQSLGVFGGDPTSVRIGQGQHGSIVLDASHFGDGPIAYSTIAAQGVQLKCLERGAHPRWDVFVDYSVCGSTEVSIIATAGDGTTSRHLVMLDVRQLQWLTKLTWAGQEGPEAREHAVLLPLPGGDGYLLHGGSGYEPKGVPFNDTWILDLATERWRRPRVIGNPPPQGSRRAALSADGATAWLFGGYGPLNTPSTGLPSCNELWRAEIGGDAIVFQKLEQVEAPSPRGLHAFMFDQQRGRFVCFGGVGKGNDPGPYGDTWTMTLNADRAHWTKLGAGPGPSGRYGFFAGFDAERGRLIVFSGAQGMASVDPAKDTWSLDLASNVVTWRRLASGNEPGSPPGRRNGVAVFDPTGPRLFVFGGTADMKDSEPGLWAFDVMPGHERWYRIDALHPAPIRSSAIGFYDRHRGRVVLGFGNAPHTPFRDIWSAGYD